MPQKIHLNFINNDKKYSFIPINKGSWLTRARAQNNPAFTAGGKREAEIATPTMDPVLSPNTDSATPAPEGMAISAPTPRALSCPLDIISSVGHLVTP